MKRTPSCHFLFFFFFAVFVSSAYSAGLKDPCQDAKRKECESCLNELGGVWNVKEKICELPGGVVVGRLAPYEPKVPDKKGVSDSKNTKDKKIRKKAKDKKSRATHKK